MRVAVDMECNNQHDSKIVFLGRNIYPIRKILQRAGGDKNEPGRLLFVSFFPYLPWKTPASRKVAVYSRALSSFGSRLEGEAGAGESLLDFIMRVPPLLQAFEGYCRKALCSEVMNPQSRLLLCVFFCSMWNISSSDYLSKAGMLARRNVLSSWDDERE